MHIVGAEHHLKCTVEVSEPIINYNLVPSYHEHPGSEWAVSCEQCKQSMNEVNTVNIMIQVYGANQVKVSQEQCYTHPLVGFIF